MHPLTRNLPGLDREALDRLRAYQRPGRPSLLARMVTLFIEGGPRRLAELRDALHGGDGAALAGAAHRGKSLCAYLGAAHLAALLADLEKMGKDGRLAEARLLFRELEKEYARVGELLRGLD